MKFNYQLLILSIILITTACGVDSFTSEPEIEVEEMEHVFIDMDLDNLEVGQKFYYTLFTAEEVYNDENVDFTYTGDTLELEVISEGSGSFLIRERLTPKSNMLVNETNYYHHQEPDYSAENYWTVLNDSLFLTDSLEAVESHLLTRSKLNLINFEEEGVEMNGWKTSFPFSERDFQFYLLDYTLNEQFYDRLNVFINNTPMSYGDNDGATIVYSRNHGIVRSSRYDAWVGNGTGWDRIK